MSDTSLPPQAPPANDSARAQAQLITAASVACVVLCPLILALPPRKLDVYSIALVSSTFVGGNQLAHEYTGRSILTRIQEVGTPQSRRKELPISTQNNAVDRGVASRLSENMEGGVGRDSNGRNAQPFAESKKDLTTRILAEVEAQKTKAEEAEGVLSQTRQKSQWKQERDKREREALEEGKGYGDMISDQIWEVWNWGKDKTRGNTGEEKSTRPNKDSGSKP
ncbi:hypothetical protein HYALB_00012914 [Hymenoscyphus albidus]|uniref:Uncharacterized protein n=1 Tax=Hymenoscyphus albidus TaxID=595503 RepID=A0A9N9Q899_9HELO|nr:hypothetical protein HYALB_00012914 [Hymenoscyphus albidus]